jgi:hypothetical protein
MPANSAIIRYMTKPGSSDSTVRPGAGDGRQRQHLDQLVGAVAEQQRHVRRDAHGLAQRRLQCTALRVRVAVQRGVAQLREPVLAQGLGPGVGILHGVELDQPGAVGDVVGAERADLGASSRSARPTRRRSA